MSFLHCECAALHYKVARCVTKVARCVAKMLCCATKVVRCAAKVLLFVLFLGKAPRPKRSRPSGRAFIDMEAAVGDDDEEEDEDEDYVGGAFLASGSR